MLSLYVSASKIDEFRKVVRAEEHETWLSEEKLIKAITDPEPLGWQATWGSALHDLIADGGVSGDWTSREGQTVHWPLEIVQECARAWPAGCIFERRAIRDYRGPGWTLTVGGRTDGVRGLGIIEGKTRFGYVTAQDYAESLQWRLYLAALPWAHSVQYRVHEIGGMRSDDDGDLVIAKGGPVLKGIHTFTMWRQPDIEAQAQHWAGRFVDWARAKGLTDYLKAHTRGEEAA